MIKRLLSQVLPALAMLCVAAVGSADDDEQIRVITQNQYLGAELIPLAAAPDPASFNAAVIVALQNIAANNYPERVQALAKSIRKRRAHLVGLQEMYEFGCTPTSPTIPDPCGLFGPAFSNHTELTLAALQAQGADYYEVARVRNLAIESIGFPVPGIPVFLDLDMIPDIFVTVVDNDVILARGDVPAEPVTYLCPRPSEQGCNFETVAPVSINGLPFNIERGFVAVDAVVGDLTYRFVNTHLEIRFPDPTNPLSRFIQSAQATELIGTLAFQPGPPGSELIVVGDINSDPDDPYPSATTGPFLTPYQQFVSGRTLQNAPIADGLTDVWTLRKKPRPGFTCCEPEILFNPTSQLERRVDIIFSGSMPEKARSRVLNTRPRDRTPTGLWPSDHATVLAVLEFDDDDDDGDDDDDEDDD